MLSVLLSNQFAFTFLCSTRVQSSSHRSTGFFCFWQKLVRSFLICAVRLKEINSTGIGTDYWNFVKVTTPLGMKGYLQVAERALCLHSPYCLKCPVPQWHTVGNSAPPQTENTSKKERERLQSHQLCWHNIYLGRLAIFSPYLMKGWIGSDSTTFLMVSSPP